MGQGGGMVRGGQCLSRRVVHWMRAGRRGVAEQGGSGASEAGRKGGRGGERQGTQQGGTVRHATKTSDQGGEQDGTTGREATRRSLSSRDDGIERVAFSQEGAGWAWGRGIRREGGTPGSAEDEITAACLPLPPPSAAARGPGRPHWTGQTCAPVPPCWPGSLRGESQGEGRMRNGWLGAHKPVRQAGGRSSCREPNEGSGSSEHTQLQPGSPETAEGSAPSQRSAVMGPCSSLFTMPLDSSSITCRRVGDKPFQ